MSSIGFNVYNHNSEPAHHVRRFMFSPTPESCFFSQSNYVTSSVAVQGSTSTTSTEELKPIQIRHQDISTKNKTVTLLANVLQRLTEQTFCSRTKRYKNYKSVSFVLKGDASELLSAIKLHRNLSDKQETVWT